MRPRDNRLHWSDFKCIAPPNTPHQFQHNLAHSPADTLSFRLGRFAHLKWLLGIEPWVYEGRRDKRIKEYAEQLAAHNNETPLNDAEKTRVLGMVNALNRHPLAMEIRDTCREYEKQLIWTRRGIECAGHLDMCGPRGIGRFGNGAEFGILAELKSCESRRIEPRSFQRQGEWYHYPEQCAWYAVGNGTDVLERDTNWPQTWVVSVESNGAFDVACHLLSPLRLDQADKNIEDWLTIYNNCKATNSWPGHAEGPVAWDANVEFNATDSDD